jgi:hypothetical protein
MSALLVLALLAADPAPHVRNLLCTGTDISSGSAVAGNALVIYQADNGQFKVRTKTLTAAGTGKADAASYQGRVQTAEGATYAFSLNRQTGEFVLFATSNGQRSAAEYSGICREVRI